MMDDTNYSATNIWILNKKKRDTEILNYRKGDTDQET